MKRAAKTCLPNGYRSCDQCTASDDVSSRKLNEIHEEQLKDEVLERLLAILKAMMKTRSVQIEQNDGTL